MTKHRGVLVMLDSLYNADKTMNNNGYHNVIKTVVKMVIKMCMFVCVNQCWCQGEAPPLLVILDKLKANF